MALFRIYDIDEGETLTYLEMPEELRPKLAELIVEFDIGCELVEMNKVNSPAELQAWATRWGIGG